MKPAAEELKKPQASALKEPPKKEQPPPQKPDPTAILKEKAPTAAGPEASREDLEQRRTILQNLKDFDFQIKKNQEDITNVSEKVESLSKDLDDLVSLYEIVSEQMNPFVGLSKVTKKRLDALENITAEVDALKTKVGDFETVFEKGSRTLTAVPPNATTAQTDTKNDGQPPSPEAPTTPSLETTSNPTQPPTTAPQSSATLPTIVLPASTTQSTMTGFSDADLDQLLSKAFESFLIEQRIDSIMNEFFQGLK